MSLWKATATWVPRGARIADGKTVTLYTGRDEHEAHGAVERIAPLLRWFIGDGIVLLDVTEDGEARVYAYAKPALAAPVPAPSRSPGYPACACGSPMVPGDIAGGVVLGKRELFCVACGVVRATPEQRLRAQTAAKAEREGRAA